MCMMAWTNSLRRARLNPPGNCHRYNTPMKISTVITGLVNFS